MTIDCPIGPVPFPIGGDTIHAACPLEDVHVHVHDDDNDDTQGKDSSVTDSDSSLPKLHPLNGVKSALSYVRVVRRNVDTNPLHA